MKIPRLRVESELQLLAYATATAMWDPSCLFTPHGNAGSLTHWVRPGSKPTSSWILVGFVNHWATTGTSGSVHLFQQGHNDVSSKPASGLAAFYANALLWSNPMSGGWGWSARYTIWLQSLTRCSQSVSLFLARGWANGHHKIYIDWSLYRSQPVHGLGLLSAS